MAQKSQLVALRGRCDFAIARSRDHRTGRTRAGPRHGVLRTRTSLRSRYPCDDKSQCLDDDYIVHRCRTTDAHNEVGYEHGGGNSTENKGGRTLRLSLAGTDQPSAVADLNFGDHVVRLFSSSRAVSAQACDNCVLFFPRELRKFRCRPDLHQPSWCDQDTCVFHLLTHSLRKPRGGLENGHRHSERKPTISAAGPEWDSFWSCFKRRGCNLLGLRYHLV